MTTTVGQRIDPAMLATLIHTALRASMDNTDRSLQSQAGILGPSDIGWCRNKAALKLRKVTPSDTRRIMPLLLGTALHKEILGSLAAMFPTWVIEGARVTATLNSGRTVSGTPDLIIPEWNILGDLKGVDGFEWIKRTGVSKNYAMQRHLYVLGAIEQKLLDADKPIMLAEIYVDRSGQEEKPFVIMDEVDWSLTNEIESWLREVESAAASNTNAAQDIPAPVCEKICEYFTVCRGGLPVRDDEEEITDPDLIEAVNMYTDGQRKEAESKRLKSQAKVRLQGINGVTPTHSVRWTEIAATTVESFKKDAYLRMDVRKRRK